MSDISIDWMQVKLRDLAEVNLESIDSSKKDEEYLYIEISSVDQGKIKFPEKKIQFQFLPSRAKRIIKKYDILMSTVRPNLLGYALYKFSPKNHVCSTGFAVITSKEQSDAEFIYQYLYSEYIQNQINSLITGSNYPAINSSDVSNLRIFCPKDKSERKKIAEILSTWDEAIHITEELIAALEKRKKGLMQRLLTGQLRFPGFTGEWNEVKISKITKSLFCGGTPSRAKPEYYDGSIPWIKSGEVNQVIITGTEETISQDGYNNSSAKMVKPNTVLVALYGATAGKIGITMIEASINQALLAIIPNGKIVNNQFFFYELQQQMPLIMKKLQGGQPNLNSTIIKESLIIFPTLDEQQKIVNILSILDENINLTKRRVVAIKQQKQGLMQRLLSGRLRVRQ